MKYYTGVGSRETPEEIQMVMRKTAEKLASLGWTLRSGGAKGADSAFELGWLKWYASQTPWPNEPLAEIYLPRDNFNKHTRDGNFGANILVTDKWKLKTASILASTVHPNWAAVGDSGFAFDAHTRNVFQVIGETFDKPSSMLIAWTPLTRAGEPIGGTATAINLARKYDIEVLNLNRPNDLARILKFIGE